MPTNWDERWEQVDLTELEKRFSSGSISAQAQLTYRALELFAQYAGFFKRVPPIIGPSYPWGGSLYHLFKHRFSCTYWPLVTDVIKPFYIEDSAIRNDIDYYRLDYLFSALKEKLPIDLSMDTELLALIATIEMKSGKSISEATTLTETHALIKTAKRFKLNKKAAMQADPNRTIITEAFRRAKSNQENAEKKPKVKSAIRV